MVALLEQKVGRVLVNGYPTSVEVSAAIVHGGPILQRRMHAASRSAACRSNDGCGQSAIKTSRTSFCPTHSRTLIRSGSCGSSTAGVHGRP